MCRTLSDRIGGPEKGRLLFQASLKLATFLWVFRQLVFCHFSATLDRGLHLARHRGCEGVAELRSGLQPPEAELVQVGKVDVLELALHPTPKALNQIEIRGVSRTCHFLAANQALTVQAW